MLLENLAEPSEIERRPMEELHGLPMEHDQLLQRLDVLLCPATSGAEAIGDNLQVIR